MAATANPARATEAATPPLIETSRPDARRNPIWWTASQTSARLRYPIGSATLKRSTSTTTAPVARPAITAMPNRWCRRTMIGVRTTAMR